MFYYNLTKLCKQKGISLSTLIKDLNMSTGNLSKWKSGKVPKMNTIMKISKYFGVSVDYFFTSDKLYNDFDLKQEVVFNTMVKVPVFNQNNENIIYYNNEDGYILANVYNYQNYLYLKVMDDSMAKSGIVKNSFVLIKKSIDINNGEIICYFKEGITYLKRFRIDDKNNYVVLTSEDISIEPIIIKNYNVLKDEVVIIGKAVEVRTNL